MKITLKVGNEILEAKTITARVYYEITSHFGEDGNISVAGRGKIMAAAFGADADYLLDNTDPAEFEKAFIKVRRELSKIMVRVSEEFEAIGKNDEAPAS